MNLEEVPLRKIRSFVKRSGKLSSVQRELLNQDNLIYKLPVNFQWDFAGYRYVAIEIGFGNGDNLIAQAKANPDLLFIGIEVYTLGVCQLLNKIAAQNIRNIFIVEADAVEVLTNCIPDASLDRVVLLFPDPWQKKRHHKRRIVQADFAKVVAAKLKDGGVWHMATDWQDYAEHMLEIMEMQQEFTNRFGVCSFAPEPFSRITTKFEERAHKSGHKTWDLVYDRKNRT